MGSAASRPTTTNPISMAETSSTSPSRFLELPGEIRNRIYRYCVLKDNLGITTNIFPEPPLLSVCKEIRAEASTIFYNENTFNVIIDDYDATPLFTTTQKLEALKARNMVGVEFIIYQFGGPNWHNLETWLRIGHATGEALMNIPGAAKDMPWQLEWVQVHAMHRTVDSLRDLPWERVQPILQELRHTLFAHDRKWAD